MPFVVFALAVVVPVTAVADPLCVPEAMTRVRCDDWAPTLAPSVRASEPSATFQ